MQRRNLFVALSIVVGIVLACAILPLGMLALLSFAGGEETPSAWQEQVISGSGADRVLVIEVSGVIGAPDDSTLLGQQLSHEDLLSQIRRASEDANIKAVVLRVESPGGGVVASSELHSALKKLRASGKHLVISMGDVAASGGYYIATAGERIYANPDTLTGSLGVIVTLLNVEETFEKVGLRQIVYKSGQFKDIGSPTRAQTPEEAAIFQALVDQAYQGFVDVIVEGRALPREEVLRLADGRIYTGRQARDLKLIDALGNLEEAIAGAQELAGLQEALVVRYRSRNSFRDLLLNGVAQRSPASDPLGLRTLMQPQAPRLEYRFVP